MNQRRTLREARQASGLSIAKLAREACVSETTAKRFERGEHISEGSRANLELALRRALDEREQAVAAARILIPA
jgi:transcriptional regulator with XRE-family HTH domain